MSQIKPMPERGMRTMSAAAIDWRSVPGRALTIGSAIIIYPALLALFYRSGRLAIQAPDALPRSVGWAGVAIFMALTLALPVFGFLVARSHGAQPLSSQDLVIRRMAHLTWMAVPLYTATGVWLQIIRLPGRTAWGLDALVWTIAWPAAFALLLRSAGRRPPIARVDGRDPPAALRVAHGIGATALILIFLGMHLSNHTVGLFGYAADRAVMDVLRAWYRSDFVQPVIIAGFLFMMATGPVLARYRTVTNTDTFGTLQTMAGAYLAAFLFSHMSAILILARFEHGTDTDWHYATGEPNGFFGDPGNVRLIPHYEWVVIALAVHLACGLRGIMLAHGAKRPLVDGIAWGICVAGVVLSTIIMAALLGARV